MPDDDKRPSDPPTTPIHSTGSYPVFRQSATEIAEKLEKINDPDAWLMAGELRYYAETFASWSPTSRPDDATRNRIISNYMDAYRKSLEYLVQTMRSKP